MSYSWGQRVFLSAVVLIGVGACQVGLDEKSKEQSTLVSDPQSASDPLQNAWILRNGATGYNGLPANVENVSLSDEFVTIKSSGIPSYSVGQPNGWPDGNPATPGDQKYQFKIPRKPVEETGKKTATPLGSIGVLNNGVPIFNALDAQSHNNQGIWNRNAHFWEKKGMDNCNGHPAPGMGALNQGRYHHHFYPVCLLATHYPSFDGTKHSPLIGWAFDGYPVYGPYGYPDAKNNQEVTRMKSSYRLRSITVRQTLPDGTVLSSDKYGPAIDDTYPLGAYVEDYEYKEGHGHLDQYNGHLTPTPEYPQGIYHYHQLLDESGKDGEYPFFIGLSYYGKVETSNLAPNRGGGAHQHPTQSTGADCNLPPGAPPVPSGAPCPVNGQPPDRK